MSFELGSPMLSACAAGGCQDFLTPGTPPETMIESGALVLTGFALSVTQTTATTDVPARFTAWCGVGAPREWTPCEGTDGPLATYSGDLPATWEAAGFAIASPGNLFIRVEAGQAAVPNQGTGNGYGLEGLVTVAAA